MERERLPNGHTLWVDETCTFGIDAVVLASFAEVKDGERVCDLGTGCGILPLLWQTDTCAPTVDAVECWGPAVRLARRSVEENGLSHRITVHEQFWECLSLPSGTYDRVVCNPPYFAPRSGKVSDDPARCLARHEKEDTLQSVTRTAARLLKGRGHFVLCHRPERLPDVLQTLREQGLEPKRLQWVHARPDAPPFIFLCDAVKGGRPSLTVLPPLFL
jgi:tRNA1(Val) A37 N6-methylase TrmN6